MRQDPARHRVVVLVLPPVIGYDATIPVQLFGSAVDADGQSLYDVRVASLDGRAVATIHDFQLLPGSDASVLRTADTVIVPGSRYPGPRDDGSLSEDVRAALAALRPGTRIVSICTGAFVLAAAGLLDGRRATTHWGFSDLFRSLYPAVDLQEDQLFVDDGDVLTSAGLSAGVDLCLHLIRRDHGVSVANRTARYCVVAPHREGGQAQFIERPVPAATGPTTAAARDWALEHLAGPLDVATLATRAHMSVRTFNRRFREETGLAPGAWVLARRLERARQLLESTDLPIDEVAERSGLGPVSLRQHLRTSLGLSPLAYRRTFRRSA